MPELNFIEVRKDGQHKRCEKCEDIILDCTKNYILAIDLDFLHECQNNTDPNDPMYPVYNGIVPEQLPKTICPGCEAQTEWRQVF